MSLTSAGKVDVGTQMAAKITFIGLLTAGNTEPVGASYSRIAVTWNTPDPVTGQISNNGVLNFPVASGSWGTLTQWAGYDAVSGGNQKYIGPLANPIGITNNQFARLADKLLTITPS